MGRDAVATIKRFLSGIVCDDNCRHRLATLLEVERVEDIDNLSAAEMLSEARAELEVYIRCVPKAAVLALRKAQ